MAPNGDRAQLFRDPLEAEVMEHPLRTIEKHLAMNLLELTIPDRPRSRRQKYRLTAAGRQMLAEMAETKKGSLRSLSDRPGPG